MKHYPHLAVLATALFVLPLGANAKVSVGEGWDLSGKVGEETRYDTNIFDQKTGEVGRFIQGVGGDAKLTKTFKGGEASLGGGIEHEWYIDSSRDDRTNFNFGGEVMGEITQNVKGFAEAGYAQRHSNRGENLTDPTAVAGEPVRIWETSGKAGLNIRNGAWSIDPMAEVTHLDFRNTRQLNNVINIQDFRDRMEYDAGARVGYDVNSEWQIFGQAKGDWREYDKTLAGFVKRDSAGEEVLVGARYIPASNLKLEAGVGYLGQNYDNGTLEDASTVGAMASIDWRPMQDVRWTTKYHREIAEATAATHSFRERDILTNRVTYEVTESVDVSGLLRYVREEYENAKAVAGSNRVDDLLVVGGGVDYEFVKNVHLVGGYDLTNNSSNVSARDYTTHVVKAGVEYRF